MAHEEQRNFCIYVKNLFPEKFKNIKVLDCGSYDVNGNNRFLFENSDYTGIDVGEGKNVDIVSTIHEFKGEDEIYDIIISTECFEHDMFYPQSFANINRMLKKDGIFMFTCATTGRSEHGTLRTDSQSQSPLTSVIPGWENYYKNLTEQDVREAMNIDDIYSKYEFKFKNTDIYFWGLKK
jgi:SAM-dependent methyltransferase